MTSDSFTLQSISSEMLSLISSSLRIFSDCGNKVNCFHLLSLMNLDKMNEDNVGKVVDRYGGNQYKYMSHNGAVHCSIKFHLIRCFFACDGEMFSFLFSHFYTYKPNQSKKKTVNLNSMAVVLNRSSAQRPSATNCLRVMKCLLYWTYLYNF